MSAKEEILGRIRTALADNPHVEPVVRDYRTTSQLSETEVIELLVDRLVDYKAGWMSSRPSRSPPTSPRSWPPPAR